MTIDDAVAGLAQPRLAPDLDILDPAAAALAVIKSVPALAVGADRAGIVGLVAQLASAFR